jgi:hypothetical protein
MHKGSADSERAEGDEDTEGHMHKGS